MKDIQAKWDEIVKVTEDSDQVLQGLRNTLFLDVNKKSVTFVDNIKYILKIIKLLITPPKRFNIRKSCKYMFLFPYDSPAMLENLLPIYMEFDNNDIIIVKNSKIKNRIIGNKVCIFKNDLPFYTHYPQRLSLKTAYASLNKLIKNNSPNQTNNFIKNKKLKYYYNILLIIISKSAAQNLFGRLNLKSLISTSDYFPIEFSLFTMANKNNIATFLIQHGIIGISFIPFTSKYMLLWSNHFKEEITEKNMLFEPRLFVIGSPKFTSNCKTIKHHNLNNNKLKFLILSDTQGSLIYPKVYENYRDFISMRESDEKSEWVVKLHPAEDSNFYTKLANKNNIIVLPKSYGLDKALDECDIAFTIWSTAGIEAIIKGIPTIILDVAEEVKEYAWWPKYGGGIYWSDLNNNLDQLFEENFLIDLINKQKEFVKTVFGDNEQVSINALNVILKNS